MGHVRASAAKGQIICKAKRKVKSASQKFRKTATAWKRANGFSNGLWALHAKTAKGEAAQGSALSPLLPTLQLPDVRPEAQVAHAFTRLPPRSQRLPCRPPLQHFK